MAINYSYPKDLVLENSDLFLGIRASDNRTVNYTAQAVSDFLNTNGEISISSQLSFRFTVVENQPKTISFPGGGGNNTLFSNITELVVSIIDVSSSNVTVFLNYLIDSDILLSQQNEPNLFGHYKITGYTQNGISPFYTLALEFIGGNGNITDEAYYDIAPLNLSQGISVTPNLQQVTDAGNVTTTEIEVSNIGGDLYNTISNVQMLIVDEASGFHHSFNINGISRLAPGGVTVIQYDDPTGTGVIKIPNVVDSTETFALLSDIPVYTIPSLKEVLAVEGRIPFFVTADYVLESTNKGETIVVDNSASAVRLDLVGLDFAIGDEIEIYNSNCTNLGLNIVFSSGAIINYKGVAYDESAGNIPLPIYSKSWLKCVDVDIFELVIIEQNNLTGYVPYTGATADVNLGEFGLLTGNIEFDNTPTNIPTAAGSMYWNDSDGTTDLILKGGNVKLQVGQEQVIRVVNKTATNVDLLESNYQAVRVTGAQGQRLKVDLAQATNDLLSAETIGLVTETINNNQEGFITTSGLVRNINTTGSIQGETWADGDILYLSPTTPGMATKVKPAAPDHLVILGYVVHAHITQGSIFVKVDNGYELDELHNVKITSPQGGQSLIYNSSLQVWENKAILDYTNNFLLMGG